MYSIPTWMLHSKMKDLRAFIYQKLHRERMIITTFPYTRIACEDNDELKPLQPTYA